MFVVSVEARRFRPDDLFTVSEVMGAIKVLPNGQPPEPNMHSAIINKRTFFDNLAFLKGGRKSYPWSVQCAI